MKNPTHIDFLLNIYYSTKGNLDQINAAIDEKIKENRSRKISIFENFIKSRLISNPNVLRMANLEIDSLEASYLSIYPGVAEVEILDVRQNHIGDEGVRAIAESPLLKNLKELDLRNNQITRKGMLFLMNSDNMGQLERLDLRVNRLGGKWWFERLKKTGKFEKLTDFKAGGT